MLYHELYCTVFKEENTLINDLLVYIYKFIMILRVFFFFWDICVRKHGIVSLKFFEKIKKKIILFNKAFVIPNTLPLRHSLTKVINSIHICPVTIVHQLR